MRIMLRAAMAALSIASIGSAYADGGDGVVANTEFTEIPGVVARSGPECAAGCDRAGRASGPDL